MKFFGTMDSSSPVLWFTLYYSSTKHLAIFITTPIHYSIKLKFNIHCKVVIPLVMKICVWYSLLHLRLRSLDLLKKWDSQKAFLAVRKSRLGIRVESLPSISKRFNCMPDSIYEAPLMLVFWKKTPLVIWCQSWN